MCRRCIRSNGTRRVPTTSCTTTAAMTLAFRHRPVPDSPLARWDARWKLAALAARRVRRRGARPPRAGRASRSRSGCCCSPSRGCRGSGFAAGSRCSRSRRCRSCSCCRSRSTPAGRVGRRAGSRLGARARRRARRCSARCLAIGCFALVLVGTAPLHHTLAAAHKLKVPGLARAAHAASRTATPSCWRTSCGGVRVALRTRGFRVTRDAPRLPHARPRRPARCWFAARTAPTAWPRRCAAAGSTARSTRSPRSAPPPADVISASSRSLAGATIALRSALGPRGAVRDSAPAHSRTHAL